MGPFPDPMCVSNGSESEFLPDPKKKEKKRVPYLLYLELEISDTWIIRYQFVTLSITNKASISTIRWELCISKAMTN